MGKIKKYKNAIERFLSGENGQRFFNFAYSIGAAIVIWGALFKILHLPAGNILLCIGMGTEVLMFMLTAFDRPGRDYHWEEVFPVFNTKDPEDRPDFNGHAPVSGVTIAPGAYVAAGESAASGTATAVAATPASGDPSASGQYVEQMQLMADRLKTLSETTEALNKVSTTLLESYQAITENSENITASARGYVEQMQALHRNVSGLNTIYELQLRSVSSQLDSIDNVNSGIKQISRLYSDTAAKSEHYCREAEKMAENMHRLNQVYEKMLRAMTINIYNPVAPTASQPDAEV